VVHVEVPEVQGSGHSAWLYRKWEEKANAVRTLAANPLVLLLQSHGASKQVNT